jgi:pyrroloquinoline-quinone synthase
LGLSQSGRRRRDRPAIQGWVNFARQQPWEVAAGSSRTELFAPAVHQARLDNWPQP